MFRKVLKYLCMMFLCASAFSTDAVYMKNGSIYRGEIIGQAFGQWIQLRLADGSEWRIGETDIDHIAKEDPQTTAPPKEDNTRKIEIIASSTLSNLLFASDDTSIELSAAVKYLFAPGLQFGTSLSWNYSNVSNTRTSEAIFLFGPTLNFPCKENVDNTAFLSLGAGLSLIGADVSTTSTSTYATTTSSQFESATKFTIGATVGGRIRLRDGINYQPSAGIISVSDLPVIFGIAPIGISVSF